MKSLKEIKVSNDSTEDMMDLWLEINPMPEFTDHDDFNHALSKAMWVLRKDEACTFFNNEEYPLDVDRYVWNIEQAINNRNSGTMLAAAMQYVENLTTNL